MYEGSDFSTSSTTLDITWLFYSSYAISNKVICHCGFTVYLFHQCAYWPFVYLLCRNVYSDPLPIFIYLSFFKILNNLYTHVWLELMTLRSRVVCTSDWASQVPHLCPFLNWATCLFIIELLLLNHEFFIYSRYKSFIRNMTCKYFLPFCACLIIFLMVSFET